eukprot:scaffold131130_cov60-Phaeocystis_antarctica.AAC.1
MAERIAILCYRRQDQVAIRPQLLRGIAERPALLLHGRQHHLAVHPQLLQGIAEHHAILPHCRQHHLAIRPQLLRGVLERPAVLLHGRQHQLAVRLQLRRGIAERHAIHADRSQCLATVHVHRYEVGQHAGRRHALVGVLCDRSLPGPHVHLAGLRCERGRLRRGEAAHHHEHACHVLFGCKEKALPSFALLGVGASGFSVVHICGAVAAGVRVRAVSHNALGEENAQTAAASANAIAHRRAARARSALAGARLFGTRSAGAQVYARRRGFTDVHARRANLWAT